MPRMFEGLTSMVTKVLSRLFVILSTLCLLVGGYPGYKEDIPNGFQVRNPCSPDQIWSGVGHEAPGGGGARNPFGIAFANNGKKWTEALCKADSDEDGLSNGYELGDPQCTWVKGGIPSRNTSLSHPGVCEPISSTKCQGKNAFLPASCLTAQQTTTTSGAPVSPQAFISPLAFIISLLAHYCAKN